MKSFDSMSQKNCQTTKKNSQNWRNIYVLPFKAMTIIASFLFFIHMNVKEFRPKINLIKILTLILISKF
jgi:heme/copper-type cytochrome/quinol oxidase subunit 4